MCKPRAFLGSRLADAVRAFIGNERGASIVVVGLALPALVGAMGLAAEISYWHLHHRAMQNAADAAAIAAATNAGTNYATEAKAVATRYGFADGSGNVTVSATNPATASGCTTNCYVVTVTDEVPLYLAGVVGYAGSTTVTKNGTTAKVTTISATAVATANPAYSYCLVALASSGKTGINANGVPDANLNGCNVMSNTDTTCNGHDLDAHFGDAHGTSTGCGSTQHSGASTVTDPYASLASSIPPNTCGGTYPQEPAKKGDPALPTSNQWSGSPSTTSTTVVCGDQQLVGNTTLNNTVLVIENGGLDTNGPGGPYTLTGTNLTIVFTGTNGGGYSHIPTGGGTLNITAPTDGTWSGMAIYQDPNLNSGVDDSAAGNSPTWEISGTVYMPHSSVTLSGAVNKSTNGADCFNLVVDNITINGTGDIYAKNDQTSCKNAGLNTPIQGGDRGTLVY